MRGKVRFLSALIIFSIIWLACEKGPADSATGGQNQNNTGTLQIRLTDAPAEYDSLLITFTEVSAHVDSAWVVIADSLQTVDLLLWNNGQSIVIGSADVPAGHYNQIRLKISTGRIVVAGVSHPLEIPSGSQSGLKINTDLTVAAGATYQLMLDFDVDRSIVTTGPPSNPNGYKLKPVIRAIPLAITGSISGTVGNPQNLPVAYAIQGTDTVTSSQVSGLDGDFVLAFLPGGLYSVSITDTAGLSYNQDSVAVTTGSDTDIGTVILSTD